MAYLTRTALAGLFLAALAMGCGSETTDTVSNRETMKLPDIKKKVPTGKELPTPPPPPVPPGR
jgi:hypothetical protein